FLLQRTPACNIQILLLFPTCRLRNINPEHWLTHLLEKINSTKKENLYLLPPQNYAANFKQ
ncbi:MAG TPA: transposase domain-containing protein, partial [Niabella sp.]|nr:transposase domain-containing protein [Niabella sp.]